MRKLLATVAIGTIVATGALAQTQPAPSTAPVSPTEGYLATNLIGEKVLNGAGEQAENIGDVNDLVFDNNGKVGAVVVGVGGFLGIGEKNVALQYDAIKWAEKDGDRWIVVAATKDELNALPAFDNTAYDVNYDVNKPAASDSASPPPEATQTTTAMKADKPTSGDAPPASATTPTPAAVDKATLTQVPATEIRTEDLVGTTVYGANDERVGEIGDVVLAADKKVDSAIVDVGGFLGLGEKEVAVGLDNLSFMKDGDGDIYLYTTFTKEQLEAQPAYDKSTYAEKRDEQRLILRP